MGEDKKTQIKRHEELLSIQYTRDGMFADFAYPSCGAARLVEPGVASHPLPPLTTQKAPQGGLCSVGGEAGIRTLGGLLTHDGFQDRCIQPLCHLSETRFIRCLDTSRGCEIYRNFPVKQPFFPPLQVLTCHLAALFLVELG